MAVGGGTIAGMFGTALGPDGEAGSDGATDAGGGCGTTFGVDGLKVGGGCWIGGVTGWARTSPNAKAMISAATAAQSAAGRLNRIVAISGLLRRPGTLPPEEIRELRDSDNPSATPENRAGFRKRDMNPPLRRRKTKFGTLALSLVQARLADSLEGLEPAMHKALFFALLAACAVNVACLCSHL